MSIKGKACIAGVYEHPTRKAADKSVFQLHAEAANPGETKNLPGLLIVCSDYDYYHNDKGNYHDA